MTDDPATCLICEKHAGRGALVGPLLYEDEHVLAFHAPHETVRGYLGYVFVETRRHVRGLADRTEAEAVAEALLVSRVARALERAGAEHVYSFVFDHLPHHHAHVAARHPGTPAPYRGVRVDEWPLAPRASRRRRGVGRVLRAVEVAARLIQGRPPPRRPRVASGPSAPAGRRADRRRRRAPARCSPRR